MSYELWTCHLVREQKHIGPFTTSSNDVTSSLETFNSDYMVSGSEISYVFDRTTDNGTVSSKHDISIVTKIQHIWLQ